MRCFYFRNCNQLSTFYMLEMCLCMHFPLPSWSMKIYLTFFCSLRKLIRHRICIYPISIDNNILTAILFFLPPLILLVGLWDWECRVEGGMVDCVNKFPFFFTFPIIVRVKTQHKSIRSFGQNAPLWKVFISQIKTYSE